MSMGTTKWMAGWLMFSLFCFTVSGLGIYLINSQAAMFGVYPQPLYAVDTWNPFEIIQWIVKMFQQPEYEQPSEPSAPRQVTAPATVDEIDNIYELVAYCNAHPELVNRKIEEAANQYGYTVPSVTCQAQLTTTGKSGTVETTWFFVRGKFQKIEYGLKGSNVKAKIISDESFAVSEMKLFLKGSFETARVKAEEGYGSKYRVSYYSLDPPVLPCVAIGVGMFIFFSGIAAAFKNKKWVYSTASITYFIGSFIYTIPYGPPILMAFAGITSLFSAFHTPKEVQVKPPEQVEKFLESLR